MFTTEDEITIKLDNPYFYSEAPYHMEMTGSYATGNLGEKVSFYMWDHGIGEVITSSIDAGLTIKFLHEFPYAARAKFPFMEQSDDGWWRLPDKYVPIPFFFATGKKTLYVGIWIRKTIWKIRNRKQT